MSALTFGFLPLVSLLLNALGLELSIVVVCPLSIHSNCIYGGFPGTS